jgi:hypothetical protein
MILILNNNNLHDMIKLSSILLFFLYHEFPQVDPYFLIFVSLFIDSLLLDMYAKCEIALNFYAKSSRIISFDLSAVSPASRD